MVAIIGGKSARWYEEKKDQGIVVGAGTVIKWCKELQCKGMIWRH